MIRGAGGNDDHPDSVRFPFLYKLLSAYSLLKPPKGSNVSNGEAFTTFCHLMNANQVFQKEETRTFSVEDIWSFAGEIENELDDPDNNLEEAEYCTIEHFAGYVVKRAATKFTNNCECCIESLKGNRNDAGQLLSTRDRFNKLHVASTAVLDFTDLSRKKSG